MSTKLYMQSVNSDVTNYTLADKVAPTTSLTTAITNTVTGATSGVQKTKTAGGTVIKWLSPPLAGTITLSGTITLNGWAKESATAANAGMEVRVLKYSGGAEGTTVLDSEFGTELTASMALQNWTASATSTAFAIGDRIMISWYINDAGGTMASGRTVTLDYAGSSAGADGDTWVQFTQDPKFTYDSTSTETLTISSTPSATGDFPRSLSDSTTFSDSATFTYVAAPLDPSVYSNCKLALRMDNADISSTTYTDYSGNSNTGTAVNGPTSGQTGQLAQAVLFDRDSNQYINCGNGTSLRITGNITIAAWVNVTSTPSSEFNGHNYVVSKGLPDGSADVGYQLKLDYNVVEVGTFAAAGAVEHGALWIYPGPMVAGTWYHVVATWDGTNWNIYWNGTLVSSNADSGPISVSGNVYIAGGGVSSKGYGGLLDDVRIYDVALDAASVTALYNYRITGATYDNSVGQSITISEISSNICVFDKSNSDSVTLSSTATGNGTFDKSNSDSITLSETPTGNGTFDKSNSDLVTISETSTGTILFDKSNSDSVTLSETSSNICVFDKSNSDSVTISDTASLTLTVNPSVSETLTLSDLSSQFLITEPFASDNFTLSDSNIGNGTFDKSTSDSVTMSDATTQTLQISLSNSDDVTLSDVNSNTLVISVSNSDNYTFTDSISNIAIFDRSVSDSTTLSETSSQTLTIDVSGSDSYTLTSTISTSLILNPSNVDGLTLTDSLISSATNFVTSSDSLTLSAESEYLGFIDEFASESISLSTSLTSEVIFTSFVSDSISVTDTSLGLLTVSITDSDSISITDSSSNLLTISVNNSDNISLADNASLGGQIDESLSESITISELDSNLVQLENIISNSITITDQNFQTAILNILDIDSISLDDSTSNDLQNAQSTLLINRRRLLRAQ